MNSSWRPDSFTPKVAMFEELGIAISLPTFQKAAEVQAFWWCYQKEQNLFVCVCVDLSEF